MSVPRGTGGRSSRISARVPIAKRARLDDVVAQLARRGLAVTATELVELSVDELTTIDIDELDRKIRQWRAGNGRREGANHE